MKRSLFPVFILFFFLNSMGLQAHTRSQSFSHWSVDDQSISFNFAVDARRVTQLSNLYDKQFELDELLTQHLQESINVYQNKQLCKLSKLNSFGQAQSIIRATGNFTCPTPLGKQDLQATVTSFQAVSPTHIHIARTEFNGVQSEHVIREGRSSFNLQSAKPVNDFCGFTSTGFMHVLSGLDHLVFLLALVLVANTPRMAILCITGFTLGHTLALALASLGSIQPNEKLIEAVIGFTIAITALEAGVQHGLNRKKAMSGFAVLTLFIVLFPFANFESVIAIGLALTMYAFVTGHFSESQAMKLLPLMTVAFGLVHGAGFAGGLKEATLFQSEILVPLLGFNVGVELAQIAVLAGMYTLFLVLKQFSTLKLEALKQATTVMVFGLGCFWFAERLWG